MRTGIIIAALLTFAAAGQAGAAEPITKREAREDRPAAVHRKVLGQIGDLMDLRPTNPGKPLRTPLDFTALTTLARTTPYTGLCRIDILWVEFAKAGSTGTGPDEPRRASGFTATSYFGFKTPPPEGIEAPYALRAKGEYRPQTEPCRDALEDIGFTAEDDDEAVAGYLMFRRIIREAANPSWSVECRPDGWEKAACLRELAELKPERLVSVSDCGPFQSAAAAAEGCVDLEISGDTIIRVYGGNGFTVGTGKGIPITRVQVVQQLILYHERNYD